MTDQKPTGVFLRLPLSDEQVDAFNNAKASAWMMLGKPTAASTLEAAILAIGTPVQGDELDVIGFEVVHSYGSDLTYPQGMTSFQGKGVDLIIHSLVRQSEAQAQIAARDAEIVRLREALASRKRENFNAGYLLACCNIVNMHNEEGIASDILAQAGITEAEVKALDLSEYDANALVEIRKASSEDPILKGGAA